ncbi:MAG: S1 RNA-binding domain-containing protein, partial [Burkholderiaceae bacterium]
DGLVHVSQLSSKFVQDAREVVKTGDIVKVKVVEVDLARQRIALTMKLDTQPQQKGARNSDNSYRAPARNERMGGGGQRSQQPAAASGGQNAMAAAFAKLQTKR